MHSSTHNLGWPLRGARLLVVVAFLSVVTWVTGATDFRMTTVQDGVLLDVLPADLSGWSVSGPSGSLVGDGAGAVLLSNSGDGRVFASHTVALPPHSPDGRTIRFRGYIERVGPASYEREASRRFRVVLRWLDADEKPIGTGGFTRFSGLLHEYSFELVGEAPAAAEGAAIFIYANTMGAWRLTHVSIDMVRLTGHYTIVAYVLVVCWLVVALMSLLPVLWTVSFGSGSALVGVLGCLIVSVALARPLMSDLLGPLTHALQTHLPEALAPSLHTLQKSGHAIGFGVLAVLLIFARGVLGFGVAGALALGVMLAFATEALQRHRLDRSANFLDVGIDVAGMAIAVLFWYLITRRRKG